MKDDRVLIALLSGTPMGRVEMDLNGKLSFTYEEAWPGFEHAVPLSLSLPLDVRVHPHDPVEAFLWGLLPDNSAILDGWGKRFHVSAGNPFALLRHVGEDCAGAVQFVAPSKVGAYEGGGPVRAEWLDDEGVARRLAALRADPGAWRARSDQGQFSLAGAQAKTALLFHEGRWGVPSGRTPTTHILKPPVPHLDGHVENEHMCLQLARALGLPAASSEVRRFGDEIAIVVERFDRARTADLAAAAASADAGSLRRLAKAQPIVRIHQEDLCQALGVKPTSKYENEGGPGALAIVGLLRKHSSEPDEDVRTFLDALVLNWLIAGTDGHAKNYGILHGGGGQVRLAPLYDVASALPYPDFALPKLKLAMKVGDTYRLREIGARQWRKLASSLRMGKDSLLARVGDVTRALPDAIDAVREKALGDGLEHPIVDRLADALTARARQLVSIGGN